MVQSGEPQVMKGYLVKWNLFWDGILTGRTHGAIVRLTPGEAPQDADQRLQAVTKLAYVELGSYIPK